MAVLYEDFWINSAFPGVSGLMTVLKIVKGDTPEWGDGAGWPLSLAAETPRWRESLVLMFQSKSEQMRRWSFFLWNKQLLVSSASRGRLTNANCASLELPLFPDCFARYKYCVSCLDRQHWQKPSLRKEKRLRGSKTDTVSLSYFSLYLICFIQWLKVFSACLAASVLCVWRVTLTAPTRLDSIKTPEMLSPWCCSSTPAAVQIDYLAVFTTFNV